MPDLSFVYGLIAKVLPFECLQMRFMQQALLGLLLLVPMTAAMGVQVVNFRMAFFADAVSHSAFAGLAIGLLLALEPHWSMLVFGLAVGLGIMAAQRNSALSSDTLIGVFFSTLVAFGLAVVSRSPEAARNIQQFLYGDILTVAERDIWLMSVLFAALMIFQFWGYNRMLYIGMNPVLARTHRVSVAFYQYTYAGLLALVVIFAVWAVGVLLVTALLIVPAATARNLARSAGSMFWWAMLVSLVSAVSGLILSAQDWARTATGATIILVASFFFLLSLIVARWRGDRQSI